MQKGVFTEWLTLFVCFYSVSGASCDDHETVQLEWRCRPSLAVRPSGTTTIICSCFHVGLNIYHVITVIQPVRGFLLVHNMAHWQPVLLVSQSDGVQQTNYLAQRYCQEAIRQISRLRPSPERDALIRLTEMVLTRDKWTSSAGLHFRQLPAERYFTTKAGVLTNTASLVPKDPWFRL